MHKIVATCQDFLMSSCMSVYMYKVEYFVASNMLMKLDKKDSKILKFINEVDIRGKFHS